MQVRRLARLRGCYGRPMPLSPSLKAMAEELRRRLDQWIANNPEGAARLALWMEDQMEPSLGPRAPIDHVQSLVETFVPANWWTMRVGLHQQARKLMAQTGICLIWVPPADLVEALVHADGKAAREEVLLAGSGEILDSIERVLADATHPRLGPSVAAAQEAVEAQRAGLTRAAQSLSASLLGEIVEVHFGYEDFGAARRAFAQEPATGSSFWSSRRTAVQEALRIAILQSKFRPAEAGFNRHLSAHRVDPAQFCEPHALEGLMLLGGALRELHDVYRVAERGFGPSPHLSRYAEIELLRRVETMKPTLERLPSAPVG